MQNLQTLWDAFWNRIVLALGDKVGNYLPRLVGALAVLGVGWLLARIISQWIQAGLRKSGMAGRLAAWLGGEERPGSVDGMARGISKGVFYLLMLCVLGVFFYVLDLPLLVEPMNHLMDRVFAFAPNLLVGALVAAVAWAVANILKAVVEKGLSVSGLEAKLGDAAGKGMPLGRTLGNAAYWLVLLFSLPVVLDILKLRGLLPPVQGMLNTVLGFLPNLLGAFLILALGWLLARIIQRIVTNVLLSTVPEQAGSQFGMASLLGEGRLARAAGVVAYVGILIPVLILALGALKLDAVTQPATHMLDRILTALPTLVMATVLMVVAFLVGRAVSEMVSGLLAGIGFNHILVTLGVGKEDPAPGKRTPSEVVGWLAMAALVYLSAIQAFEMVGFAAFAGLMREFTGFAVNVILGLLIFGVGLYLSSLAARTVRESDSEEAWLLAPAARLSILFMAGAMALEQMGLAKEVVTAAFVIILGAVAVAAAIAFGLGGRDIAARELEGWLKAIRSKKG